MSTLTTKVAPAKTIATIPSAILEAILAGDVAHAIEAVNVTAKASPTGKPAAQEFDALYALTAKGIQLLSGGKLDAAALTIPEGTPEAAAEELKREGAADFFNYGRLLGVRAEIRNRLMGSLEGPAKAIKKSVDQLMAGGLFKDESAARAFVIQQRKANGLAVLDSDVTEDAPADTPEEQPAGATA